MRIITRCLYRKFVPNDEAEDSPGIATTTGGQLSQRLSVPPDLSAHNLSCILTPGHVILLIELQHLEHVARARLPVPNPIVIGRLRDGHMFERNKQFGNKYAPSATLKAKQTALPCLCHKVPSRIPGQLSAASEGETAGNDSMGLSLSPSQVALILLAQICIHERFEAVLLDGLAVQLAMVLIMSAVGGGSPAKH